MVKITLTKYFWFCELSEQGLLLIKNLYLDVVWLIGTPAHQLNGPSPQTNLSRTEGWFKGYAWKNEKKKKTNWKMFTFFLLQCFFGSKVSNPLWGELLWVLFQKRFCICRRNLIEILGFNANSCLSSYIQILSDRSKLLRRKREDQRFFLKPKLECSNC